MYKNFSENKGNNKICSKSYCNTFKSENIGFSRPSQNECKIYVSYKDHIKDSDHDSDQCAECIVYAKYKVSSYWIPKVYPKGSCLFYRWYAKSYCTP